MAGLMFSILFGIVQGMTMIMKGDYYHASESEQLNGIRAHEWFDYAHPLTVLCFVNFGLLWEFLSRIQFECVTLLYAVGLFLICWEMMELAYSYARNKNLPKYENVLGIGTFLWPFYVKNIVVLTTLHWGRIYGSILFFAFFMRYR
jgi:hypothetical protein